MRGGAGYTWRTMWSVAILSCGPQLEVALSGRASTVPSVVRLAGTSPRSTLLLAALDLLIEDAQIERDEISLVAVSRGPGSFTGIRAGLATAQGLAAALGAEVLACSSLLVHAARCEGPGEVWAAQPGRRGEVYAQQFRIVPEGPPVRQTGVEVLPVAALAARGPWTAAERLDLGGAARCTPVRTGAEALLWLAERGAADDPVEPVYVEGPPVAVPGDG